MTDSSKAPSASPDSSMDETPVIDPARLNEVTEGDAAFEAELLSQFSRDMERNLRDIGQGDREIPADLLIRTAHNIKGTSANIGVMRLSAAAAALESAARQSRTGELAGLRRRVREEYARFERAWAEMNRDGGLGGSPPSP